MTLSELTLPYRERIAANLRKSLDIQDWISDHPDLHPDERAAQFALCRALEQQNEQIQEQWEAASDQWLRSKGSSAAGTGARSGDRIEVLP